MSREAKVELRPFAERCNFVMFGRLRFKAESNKEIKMTGLKSEENM